MALAISDIDLGWLNRYTRLAEEKLGGRVEIRRRGNSLTVVTRTGIEALPYAPVAQIRWDPDAGLWSLYYRDRGNRWRRYEKLPPTPAMSEVVQALLQDPQNRFRGWLD